MDHLPVSMEGLFGPHVVTWCGDPADLDEPLPAGEQAWVASAVEKRRRDFAAGRTCARRALLQLGFANAEIGVGPRREPVWPAGTIGTISHTHGFCGAAVALRSRVRALGFDAERIGDMRMELRTHIASDAELDALQRVLGGPPERALALAFSAREAFYKFQYPISRQWVGLRDVALTADRSHFCVVPAIDIAGVCARGRPVSGVFKIAGDYALTAIEATA